VDEVYYNDNTGDLYVDLDTGDGGDIYQYSNVPASVVEAFKEAPSAGAFYNQRIKPVYGPGKNLGPWTGVKYDREEVEAPKQQITLVSSGTVTVVPQTTTVAAQSTFSLKPFNDNGVAKVEGIERDYVVTFEVDGLDGRKTHRLKSDTVDNAVQSVLDLGKMLDLTFIVREVTITFE